MGAVLQYEWDYIAPNTTVSELLYGFSSSDIATFDAIPVDIGDIGTAPNPLFEIQLTPGPVSIWVDNSIARVAHVQNLAPFNATGASLYLIFA